MNYFIQQVSHKIHVVAKSWKALGNNQMEETCRILKLLYSQLCVAS